MKARVQVVITYTTEVTDDPEYYEGAATPEERMAKEKEYIEEDGDYLAQSLAIEPYEITATVTPAEVAS